MREMTERYRASKLGLLWSVLTPLAMLAVYTFAFAIVFKARWGNDPSESRAEFALAMFCGLLLFNLFAEVVNRAPSMVVSRPSYVKRALFPLEAMVVAGLISAMMNMLIGYGVWLVGWVLLTHAPPHLTVLWFPVVLTPVCLATLGVAWFLASLGVFLRDVGHAVQVALSMLFFPYADLLQHPACPAAVPQASGVESPDARNRRCASVIDVGAAAGMGLVGILNGGWPAVGSVGVCVFHEESPSICGRIMRMR